MGRIERLVKNRWVKLAGVVLFGLIVCAPAVFLGTTFGLFHLERRYPHALLASIIGAGAPAAWIFVFFWPCIMVEKLKERSLELKVFLTMLIVAFAAGISFACFLITVVH